MRNIERGPNVEYQGEKSDELKKEQTEDMAEKQKLSQKLSKEDIFQLYWRIEKEQLQKEAQLKEKMEEVKKRAEKFGIDLKKTPISLQDPRAKLFEKSLEIGKQKEQVKQIIREFKGVDDSKKNIDRIVQDLKKKVEDFDGRILFLKKHIDQDPKNILVAIRAKERQKKELEGVIKSFEKGDLKPLKDFLKRELEENLQKEWKGEEGFARLQQSIILKEALNTLQEEQNLENPEDLKIESGQESEESGLSPKEKRLKEIEKEVEKIRDALGKPIDSGIKETVVVLHALEFPTSLSCEGHSAKDPKEIEIKHKSMAPFA